MRRLPLRAALIMALNVTLIVALAWAPVHAADAVSSLQIKQAWIRWLPASLPAGGYLIIANDADQPRILVGADSPAYSQVQLHRSITQGGLSKMVPVARITIAPHSTLSFAARGYHLMLSKPRVPVSPGDHVPITLRFADGASLLVKFEVRSPSAAPAGGMSNMPGMQP